MRKFLLRGILVVFGIITVTFICKNSEEEKLTYHEVLLQRAGKHKKLSYEEIKKLPKRDRPDLAALQDYEMTMDPALGYPPIERKIKAFKIAKSILAKSSNQAKILGVEWEERGPNNVGGRTRTLMFDPNDASAKKVWAGGIGGGLWYNTDITDEQSIWQSVDDFMANIAISAIEYDPSNTQTYYLGTGPGFTRVIRGAGIWKSSDAGTSWSRLSSTEASDFHFIQKIQVTDNGTVLVATNAGLQRSTDGGTTWANVLSNDISDIEIASDGNIFASKGHNSTAAIFKSDNDGQSWTDISPNDAAARVEIGVAPSNPNVIYAVADGGSGGNDVAWFKKSIDGGIIWNDIEIPLYLEQDCNIGTQHFTRRQAWFDLIIGVHPLNENIVVVGGIDLHKSINGGESWGGVSYWTGSFCDDYVHADQHAMVFRPGFPDEAIFGNDGGVYYSADVGDAANPEFEARNNGYNVTTFYSAATANVINSNVFLAGAQDNGTQLFSEPGMNSTVQATGGDGGYCFIDQDNPEIMISSSVFNSYRLSQDGGKSFVSISDDQNTGRFINPSEYDSKSDILYGAGGTNEITRIQNISSTPSSLQTVAIAVDNRQITHIKASPFTDNLLFIGVRISNDEGKLYKVENAETNSPTVTEITGAYTGSHGGWISSIDVGASDDHLLATFSNYGVSSVYETIDGGVNWIDKNGNLPDIPVRWGLYNPNNRNEVLLATEVGVWSTDDLSLTTPVWEPTNIGLANVRTDMIKYRASDQLVTIATFGRGLYTSNVFVTITDADFSTKQTVAYVGVPVEFTDASLNPNDSWSWTFGDGVGTSTDQNASYAYTTPGEYDVTLSIDGGSITENKAGYVTVLPLKSIPYTLADGGDFESNPNDFVAQAITGGESHWELGVPANRLTTVSSGTNVWKTKLDSDIGDLGFDYKSGLYTPAFDLSDDTKDYTLKFKKSMENSFCNSPHAMQLQFSTDGGINWFRLGGSFPEAGAINWYNMASNLSCSLNQDVFQDKTGWVGVNIDGGTDATVDNENTEYKLNFLIGQSNVSFRFVSAIASGSGTGAYDRDGFMIDDFEIEANDPIAEFEADNTLTFTGQEVKFTYLSNGATSYIWDFGDGSATSPDENPVHTYNTSGTYTVSLTIDGSGGQFTDSKTNYIAVLPDYNVPYELNEGGDFESNQSDFIALNISGTPFELGNSSIAGKDGAASGANAWVTGLADSNYQDDSEAYLYTPNFSFTDIGAYTLKFKAMFIFETNWDGFIVEYSVDKGGSWVKLNDNQETNWYNQISDPQSIFGVSVPIFSGTTNESFEEFFTDVSFLAPNESVVFRFKFLSDSHTVDVGLALDDFELDGPVAGPATPDFIVDTALGCVGRTAVFTNASVGSISSITWDFGTGASPAMAEGVGPHEVVYSSVGASTVSMTVTSPVNGNQVETKMDFITTGADHIPSITEEDNGDLSTYELVASPGDAYQWVFKGAIIEGAIEQVYIAEELGKYEVDVTVSGCVGRSDGITVVTSTEEFSLGDISTQIYPNPTVGDLNISLQNDYFGAVSITVYDLQGKKMQGLTRNFEKSNPKEEFSLNVSHLKSGMYMAVVVYGNNRLIRQVVIGE